MAKGIQQYDSVQKLEGIEKWTPTEVADYFESEGLGDYREVLIHHKIVSLHTDSLDLPPIDSIFCIMHF